MNKNSIVKDLATLLVSQSLQWINHNIPDNYYNSTNTDIEVYLVQHFFTKSPLFYINNLIEKTKDNRETSKDNYHHGESLKYVLYIGFYGNVIP